MKVHFHTDSPFVGGSENMLVLLLNSNKVREQIQPSFSYRHSYKYEMGIKEKLRFPSGAIPIRILEPMRLGLNSKAADIRILKGALSVIRKLVFFPAFFYQCALFSFLFLRIRPDILHVNAGGYPAALSTRAAVVAGRISGVRNIIYVSNNLAVPYDSLQRVMEYPIDYLVQKSARLFITGSSAACDELKKVLSRSNSNFKVINNGIDINESDLLKQSSINELKDDKRVVLAVIAVLELRKGHQVLLESIYHLLSLKKISSNSFILLIEGEGKLRQDIEKEIARMQLSDVVKMVGRAENIFEFIAQTDILILPSLYQEDFPNVILESMAFSKPVIATKVGGIPEQVVDGTTGFLVAPNNPSALADRILCLLESQELRHQMGGNARIRFVQNYTAELAIDRYLAEYDRLLKSQDATS